MSGGSGFVAAWLVMESTGNENPGEIGSTLFSTSACMAQCRTGRAGAAAGRGGWLRGGQRHKTN